MGNIKNKNMNMKNTKTKIILSAIIFLSVIGFVGTVDAAGASLYVSPATLTKTAGNSFSVSVGLNASGNKVCAVEGTIVFNNLSCQSITVASDVMAQSSPICSNPHFLIGIPNCTTSDKILLTVSVKGVSVGSASTSGNYTINAVPTPKSTEQVTQPEVQQEATIPSQEVIPENNIAQTAALGATPAAYSFFGWVWANIIWIIVILLVLVAIYFIIRKIRKKK